MTRCANPQCGALIVRAPGDRGRPRAFCSPVCKQSAREQRDRALRLAGKAAVETFEQAMTAQSGASWDQPTGEAVHDGR